MSNLIAVIIALIMVIGGIVAAVASILMPMIGGELVRLQVCKSGDTACTTFIGLIVLIAMVSIPIISCAIIGLVIALLWRKRHGLEIFYDNDDKRCRHYNNPGNEGKPCYYICLKIINKSNKMAVSCVGRLEIIADDKGVSCSDWTSSRLCWEHQSPKEIVPISIGPNAGSQVLDIGWVNEGEDKFKLRTDQSEQGFNPHRPRGKYFFLIAVSADGFDTVKQWFEVRWFRNYDDFKMYQVRKPLSRT